MRAVTDQDFLTFSQSKTSDFPVNFGHEINMKCKNFVQDLPFIVSAKLQLIQEDVSVILEYKRTHVTGIPQSSWLPYLTENQHI